jgi:chromosome segregation ATPase
LKVDVELENTIRTTEAKVKAHKATALKHAKDIEEVRSKLNESETAREALAAELAKLQNSASGSSSETSALRQRIETLEASNRDALALVESKSIEKDQIATELAEHSIKKSSNSSAILSGIQLNFRLVMQNMASSGRSAMLVLLRCSGSSRTASLT